MNAALDGVLGAGVSMTAIGIGIEYGWFPGVIVAGTALGTFGHGFFVGARQEADSA